MKVLKIIFYSILSALTLFGVGIAIIWISLDQQTKNAVKMAIVGPYSDNRDPSWHTDAGEELIRANNDHYNIAYEISRCFREVDLTKPGSSLPGKYVVSFLLGLQPSGEQGWSDNSQDTPDIYLTNYQRAVLFLSEEISLARSQFSSIANQSKREMTYLQIIIIILGGLTTVFVSIKSSSNSSSKAFIIVGILAIIFSSAGTAASSLNSFLGPSDDYLRSERALAQLRRLHLEIALQVAKTKRSASQQTQVI